MANLYCSVCGRPVSPTVHFKDHYVVDYYTEITGDTEPVIIASSGQDRPDVSYLKLTSIKEIVRCVGCMRVADGRF
ncbi:MAG: hypothetical protein M1517_07080 [Deltaproteobacteria bacterium]|nr:hypothetical protein [Deltaproteobacteria bacterium]